ncbi:KxYKxGKxW signal domain protein, partial [Streptococcus australis ATCC 700641]
MTKICSADIIKLYLKYKKIKIGDCNMYFNRKNTEQKNWRMIKKGKHFLFGCSLVLAIGGTFVAPSVKADTVEPQPESSTTNEEEKPTSKEESSTYVAPAVTVASTTVAETNTAPATDEKTKEESEATVEKTKESDAIQAPSLTMVADPAALTEEEKANVAEAVKGVNPTATDVQVQSDGTVVVTFADGSSATLTPSQTIKAGSQVVKPRRARAVTETTSATRATEGSQNLDYSNRDNPEGYIKMNYEVDDAQNTIHWSVVVNGGRIGNQTSGYSYFTVPKDSVGAPTNWRVLQTDKYGNTMSDRRYWKNNDGIYTMGGAGRMNLYTGSEMTKELTRLYEKIGNPAIKGNEAAAAQQASERSQALYRLTADVAGGIAKNPSWTITFDTPIVDKSKTLDYTAGLQGTGAGKKTNIMTGYADNFIDNSSSKFQAVAVKEKYTAKVGGSFDATPANYVTNKPGTPEFPNNYRGATTFAWKDGQAPTATTPGTYTKTVVVTYPAHYNQAPQEVTVTFEVEGETPKPVAPAGQAPEITSNLDGKASTPADVTVNATAGSTVKLYNKDGVVIGEAVANDQGVATITPTNSLPAGEITATTTPAGGTESAKSAPITVTKTPTPYTDPGETNAPYYKLGVGTNTTQVSVYRGDNLLLLGGGASSSLRWFGVTPETIGNVKGVKYTEFLRTRTNAQGKLEGPVAWDQPLGETKVVFGATGSENATSRKLLSVYRPITVTVLETTKKYDPVAGTKVDVADSNNLSVDDKNKVIAAVKAANANSKLPLPADSQYSVDEKGNLTITYPDGSTDKIAAAYLVNPTKDTTAPDKPVVNTDLTGKAGTKTPVEVTAEKGSTVALYDKDNNKIGEATAGENGKATITPTVDIPAGAVTAKATDAAGNTSVASDPATATPAADTEAPAKPVVNTDLTGKAGTKTPVEVTAEKGSTVALYDKDNNKIGEATAGENGKATITPTVNIPAGAVTAKATDAAGNTSVASDPATATAPAATVVAPTVEIPYSNKDIKEVYVYAGEENSFDIKFKDDSGKIVSATVKQGGNREFSSVAGEADTINTQYGFKANVISSETPATADSPAVITYRGTPAATDGLSQDRLDAATKGENPAGLPLGWRYATATDADGALIENKATGSSSATDPGAFRVVLKAQNQKYDIATPAPAEKVTVADPANVTEDDLAKIKEKLQLEYSKTNDDANLADKKGTTADKANKIQSVTKDDNGNLVVTYTDGSQDKKPLSEFVTTDTEAPAKPVVNTDLTGKAGTKTPVEVSAEPGSTVALYDKDGNKIGEATAGENGRATITPTVDIPAGAVTAKATDAAGNTSDASEPTTATAAVVAPTVEIPYSNKDNKEVYVYAGEENSFDIKFKDDSGKIVSATVKQGGNRAFSPVAGEENTINTQYGFKANVISTETPATAETPAVITYRGTPAATDGLSQDRLDAATKGENPEGMVLGWRYATATDADGALIENKATGSSSATDPGAFRVVLKAQNQKYDIATPSEKVTVADPANVTEAELAKIKEKVQLEYSQNNDDANLADKKGTTADKTNKIQSVTKDADGNLVVTYTDGSIDKKPLSEFVNVAPTVELPYSNQEHKQIYVYTGENTDLTFKASDNTAVKDMYVRGPGGIGTDNTANYGFTTGKIENSAVTHGDGTVSGNTATIKMTGVTTLKAPNRWTSFVVANDNDNAPSNTDFNALDKNPNATQTPGYVQFIVKSQTDKYDIATPAPTDKVEVADPTKVTDAELDKIKEKLQLEYNKNNDDANIAKDAPVDKDGKIKSVTKDADGNLVVTYTDGSTDKKPLSEFVTKDTTAPAKPVINTDLTGKAGTKTPVEVSAEPGTKVELFDKDGNKIGEGTA